MMNKKVSIIIPVYNLQKYIQRCIDSIINQSYKNIEIIIVDDGSTDSSGRIVDEIAQRNSKLIKVFHICNSGVSEARNVGIINSTGDYILFIDGDDYVENTYVSSLVDGFENNNVGLSVVDYYIENESKRVTSSINQNEVEILSADEALISVTDINKCSGYVWNKCFRRDVIIQNNIRFMTNANILEDFLFCIEYIDKINSVSYIHKALYVYVQREGSAIKKKNITKERKQLEIMEKVYLISKKHSPIFTKHIADSYSNLIVSVCFSSGLTLNYKNEINEYIKIIKRIEGKLSVKHKIMIKIMEIFPSIVYLISKINR